MGTYRHLSHTVLSCIISSEQDVWCWWPWLTGTDCVTKWSRFLRFLKIEKKHDFLRFFEMLHMFYRTLAGPMMKLEQRRLHGATSENSIDPEIQQQWCERSTDGQCKQLYCSRPRSVAYGPSHTHIFHSISVNFCQRAFRLRECRG